MNKIRIGTRGSKLALWQSNHIKSLLESVYPHIVVELHIIQTKGDKILDVALSKIGDKNLFTKEIEQALLDNEVDIAVHSLKDLPTQLPQGLSIGAVTEREEFRDVLISNNKISLQNLNSEHVIGTSSLRRQAALWNYNKSLQIKDIRGNVDTRIQKMLQGNYDAIIMAAAGVKRLGLQDYITEYIPETIITPAVSQGIIAIEIRENDSEIFKILQKIHHQNTWYSALAERAFLRTIQGGCQVPVGCISNISENTISLDCFIASLDGSEVIKMKHTASVNNAENAGKELAQLCIKQGADKILQAIK